jgi:putative FmdB family regulatory protein
MPTYQYRCARCGEEFELWQSIHDEALTRHPGCGGAVTKVFAPAGIVLKGSGFYRTDSRAAGRKSSKEKEKEPAKDGAASGNGSDSDAKSSSESSDSTSSKESKDTKAEAKPSKSGSSST